MKDFNGKVVVVTGGATGIGFALAKQFGAKGAKLVLAARRRNRLDQAASELSATGVEVRTFECDVTQRDQVEALADFAWKEFGTVDVIVNNAGHGSISSPVIEAKHEDVQRLFDEATAAFFSPPTISQVCLSNFRTGKFSPGVPASGNELTRTSRIR